MLDHKHLWSGLDVGREAASEVEVKPPEVHFFEVFAVVHVSEVVDVCCPADAVQTALLVHPDGRQHMRENSGVD